MASCQHDVIYEVDYNVTLDPANTYYAGDPVKFNLTGDVDNLLFYSGETGSQYMYKDRYEVPIEDVVSANLHLDIRGRYGFIADYQALEIWVSKDFEGINGSSDPDGDRAKVKKMVEGLSDTISRLCNITEPAIPVIRAAAERTYSTPFTLICM